MGLQPGPVWNRPPVAHTDLVPCSLLTLDDTMVLAQKQRPQSLHMGPACSLYPDALEPSGCGQAGLAVISPVVPSQQPRGCFALSPCPTLQEVTGDGLQWPNLYLEALESCSPEKVPASGLPWSPVLLARCSTDVALSTTSCLAPNPRTHSSANLVQSPSLHPYCPLCLKTPLVGSKLPPPHCLTAWP